MGAVRRNPHQRGWRPLRTFTDYLPKHQANGAVEPGVVGASTGRSFMGDHAPEKTEHCSPPTGTTPSQFTTPRVGNGTCILAQMGRIIGVDLAPTRTVFRGLSAPSAPSGVGHLLRAFMVNLPHTKMTRIAHYE